jgi:hypothetical protein
LLPTFTGPSNGTPALALLHSIRHTRLAHLFGPQRPPATRPPGPAGSKGTLACNGMRKRCQRDTVWRAYTATFTPPRLPSVGSVPGGFRPSLLKWSGGNYRSGIAQQRLFSNAAIFRCCSNGRVGVLFRRRSADPQWARRWLRSNYAPQQPSGCIDPPFRP